MTFSCHFLFLSPDVFASLYRPNHTLLSLSNMPSAYLALTLYFGLSVGMKPMYFVMKCPYYD